MRMTDPESYLKEVALLLTYLLIAHKHRFELAQVCNHAGVSLRRERPVVVPFLRVRRDRFLWSKAAMSLASARARGAAKTTGCLASYAQSSSRLTGFVRFTVML